MSIETMTSSLPLPCHHDNSLAEKFERKYLVGRHEDLMTLIQTYDRMKRTGTSESLSVHGESGTGKTSLVLALRETVRLSKGFFCMGKVFQDSEVGQDPYSAIIASFSRLCDQVLQHSDKKRSLEIQEALQPHALVLKRAVSRLSLFLEDGKDLDDNVDETNDEFVFSKFKASCKAFLRIMSSQEHPVVLFFDDVQWMDDGSRELVNAFLQATDLKYVMLIVAYRDDESEPVKDIFASSTNKDIYLKNLDFKYMSDMVSEQLGSHLNNDICDLGTIVAQKTRGNPFHVKEFLSIMKREGFLSKSCDSWTFDRDLLDNESQVLGSLSRLLVLKVRRLDMEMQQVLKLASLIGFRFTIEVILDVIHPELFAEDGKIDVSFENVRSLLEKAEKERILERVENGYQFSHDKIQYAFQNLMNKEEKEKLHLAIGQKFLNNSSKNSNHQAAVHLNRALAAIEDRVKLAKINLEASKYCEQKSAYSSSALFLQNGLKSLDGDQKWVSSFDLAFEMTESLARIEFIAGNWDASKTANDEVFFLARSTEKRTKSLHLMVQLEFMRNGLTNAFAKWALKELGISTPKKITPLHLYRKLRQVRRLVDSRSDIDILSIQPIDDFNMTTGIKLLMFFSNDCFFRKEIIYGAYFANLAAELSLKNGSTKFYTHALSQMGVMEIILGQGNRAYRLGTLSLELMKKIPSKESGLSITTEATVFVLSRKQQIRESLPLFPVAYNDAFEVGNIFSIGQNYPIYFFVRIILGENLHSLCKSMRETYNELCEFGVEIRLALQPPMQLVLNLLQSNAKSYKDLIMLKGEIMDEECKCESTLSLVYEEAFHQGRMICKMILAYIFGFHNEARKFGKEVRDTKHPLFVKSYISLPMNFFWAMISYSLYESTGRRSYLRAARKGKKFLNCQKRTGNPNAAPFLSLLEVEEMSIKSKDVFKVCQAYSRALEVVTAEGYVLLEAFTHEQTSRILSRLGYALAAKVYLDRAKQTYRDWGAIAKYQMLVDQS